MYYRMISGWSQKLIPHSFRCNQFHSEILAIEYQLSCDRIGTLGSTLLMEVEGAGIGQLGFDGHVISNSVRRSQVFVLPRVFVKRRAT